MIPAQEQNYKTCFPKTIKYLILFNSLNALLVYVSDIICIN